MDDARALPAMLRALLVGGAGQPPATTALALARVGPRAVDELAKLSVDRRLSPLQRVTVLLALSIVISPAPVALPSEALDAIENNDVVAAALAAGLGAALTSVLVAAGKDPSIEATRRLLARKLVVAGERGPHVVDLLLSVGERERAIELAAEDLSIERTPAETLARIQLLADLDPATVEMIFARLHSTALARIDALLRISRGLTPAQVAALRSAIVWASSR